MRFSDCVEFANQNKTCFLATVDSDQPRVRGFKLWYADELGFYFHTFAKKSVYRQLLINPRVEICFHAPGQAPDVGTMLRVSGKIRFLEDLELKMKLLAERPNPKMVVRNVDDTGFVIFKVYTGEAFFWKMENNLKESGIERIRF